MQGRGIVVELPEQAKARLDELSMLRDSALDASRSCQQRMNMLDDDADKLAIKLATERDKHAQRHNAAHRLLSACNQYLFQLRLPPGYVLEPAPSIDIALKKSETVFEAIDAIRTQIAAVQHEMALVRSAPLRKQSMREALTRYLASHAMRVRPRVSFDAQGNAKVLWDENTVHSKDDMLGLLSWFMGGPQELAIAFGIEQEPEPPDALTPDEKAQQLSKLADDLLALERREAALLDGADVLPRPEMSPLAYLQVRITMEAQAKVA
jgi:hypothetical protein